VSNPSQPYILIIDDEDDLQRSTVNMLPVDLKSCFKVISPDDAIETDLKHSHLVLVDYKLDKWASNAKEEELCKHVPNGLALTAILQQRVAALKEGHAVAFAIHSSHLPELTTPFSFESRIHLLSKTCNIDWAFEKHSRLGPTETFSRIRCLAEAVQALPDSWPLENADRTREEVERLLGVDASQRWADPAWSDIERAHPPLDELIQRVHGLLFLRWMLQRVLSYPCFLLDEHWLAARLAATPASVRAALPLWLGKVLENTQYRGILAGFRGNRWWRMGVEYILWELGGKRSLAAEDLLNNLNKDQEIPLVPINLPQPVICLDTDFQPLDHLHDPADAVRILPDDWPPYAEQAWATIELALSDKRISGLVIEADRPRLEHAKSNGAK